MISKVITIFILHIYYLFSLCMNDILDEKITFNTVCYIDDLISSATHLRNTINNYLSTKE